MPSPGKMVKCFHITADEGFFLGTAPAFNLALMNRRLPISIEFFLIHYCNRWIDDRSSATGSREMFLTAPLSVSCTADVKSIRAKLENVNPCRHVPPPRG